MHTCGAWTKRLACVGVLLATCACAEATVTGEPSSAVPEVDACPRAHSSAEAAVVDQLLAVLADRPVLAFGEHHGSTAEHRVLQLLVCDPRFADTMDAVVVEFGNRRLQDVVDRYVGGADVESDELASVWRESTQRSGVWEAPVYRQFFAVVRSVNRDRKPDDQVRVLAGDPPVDWSTITDTTDCDGDDPACLEHWDREASFADVVVRDVLDPGGRALLIAGAGHMQRRIEPDVPPSIPQLVELRHPGTVAVVLGLDRFLRPDPVAEALVEDASPPVLLPLAGTELGQVASCLVDDGPACADHPLHVLADGLLITGAEA